MAHESILAHLAPLLTNQIENVATDALAHLLLQYPFLSDAFREYISSAGIDLPKELTIKTQASWQDNAIPDLVGLDKDGRHVLIVESKFWAYLTPNQPTTYIERLPSDTSAILLFIAPAPRLDSLWKELLERCTLYQADGLGQVSPNEEFFTLSLNNQHILALTSWESLLEAFHIKAQQVGDNFALADIWQVQSLCARVTEEAFLPLAANELTAPTQKRINQYKGLIDELMTRLAATGFASIAGYRATPGPDYYRRYMSLQGIGNWCVEYNETYRRQFPPANLFLTAEIPRLTSSFTELAPVCHRLGNLLLIPLDMPIGVEKASLLNSLLQQVIEVAQKLAQE